ncbi:MAG: protein kinase [Planctomycetota bacterium]
MSAINEGSILGGYRLLHRIGRGGVGTVWLAEHEVMGARVALKVLNGGATGNMRERFMREARAAFLLQHPNIVRVLHADITADGDAWMVMDLVDGPSLRAHVPDAGLEMADALVLLRGICAGVGFAHSQGVLHRDIKPENILVDRHTGTARIADFGLTRLMHSESDLTHTGGVLGTPGYMSPEQWESSSSVDARADVWSIGITMWFMLCGTPPYAGLTPPQVLRKIISRDRPSLGELRPDIESPLLRVIEKMIAWNPARRFSSADAVLAALDAVERAKASQFAVPGSPAPPPPLPTVSTTPVPRSPAPGEQDTPRKEKQRGAPPSRRADAAVELPDDAVEVVDDDERALPRRPATAMLYRINDWLMVHIKAASAVCGGVILLLIIAVMLRFGGERAPERVPESNDTDRPLIVMDDRPDTSNRLPEPSPVSNWPAPNATTNGNTPSNASNSNNNRNSSPPPVRPTPPPTNRPGENLPGPSPLQPTPEQIARETKAFADIALQLVRSDRVRALDYANRAIDRGGHLPYGYFARATVYLEMSNFQRAESDASQALMYGDNSAGCRVLRGQARLYRGAEHLADAQADFEAATRLDNRMADAWGFLGLTLAVSKKWDAAIDPLDRAVRLGGGWRFWRARVHAQLGHRKEAIADFSEVIDSSTARLERARLYLQLGQTQQAEDDARTWLESTPDSAEANSLLAVVQARAGDFAAAGRYMAEAIRLAAGDAKVVDVIAADRAEVDELRRKIDEPVGDPPMSEAEFAKLIQRSRLTNQHMVELIEAWCHPGCPREWRPEIARVLGAQPDGKKLQTVLRAALKSMSLDDACKVCRLMAAIGGDDAASVLDDALDSGQQRLRLAAINALGEVGNPAALGQLCRLWSKRKPGEREYEAAAQQLQAHPRRIDIAAVKEYVVPAMADEDRHDLARHIASIAIGLPEDVPTATLVGYWADLERTWRAHDVKVTPGGTPIGDSIQCTPTGLPRGPNQLLLSDQHAEARFSMPAEWGQVEHRAIIRFQAIRGDLVVQYTTDKVHCTMRTADGQAVFKTRSEVTSLPLTDGWNTFVVHAWLEGDGRRLISLEFNGRRVFGDGAFGFDGTLEALRVELPDGGIAVVGQWELLRGNR